MTTTRRLFILGASASLGARASSPAPGADAAAGGVDPNLAVLLADPHVPGDGVALDARDLVPDHMYRRLEAVVDEILAMRPRPANVVVFGDIAYLRGERADYLKTAPLYRRLAAAGITLTLGLGNHDHRAAFFETYPELRERSLVPGCAVFRVDLGAADLVLLDSLTDNTSAPGAGNSGDGTFTAAQHAWMQEALPRWPRPFLLGAHHHYDEVKTRFGKGDFRNFINCLPGCRGYVHGHHHYWKAETLLNWWGGRTKRVVGLPSTGFFGDIGYVTLRTDAAWATARPVIVDNYFPRYQPDPAKRNPEWAAAVADLAGAVCRFAL